MRKDTHKKVFFLVVGPLRFNPPYTNGLEVHATFFGLKQPDFRKKSVFLLSGQGGLPSLHP